MKEDGEKEEAGTEADEERKKEEGGEKALREVENTLAQKEWVQEDGKEEHEDEQGEKKDEKIRKRTVPRMGRE